jgi:hypothetical protein
MSDILPLFLTLVALVLAYLKAWSRLNNHEKRIENIEKAWNYLSSKAINQEEMEEIRYLRDALDLIHDTIEKVEDLKK